MYLLSGVQESGADRWLKVHICLSLASKEETGPFATPRLPAKPILRLHSIGESHASIMVRNPSMDTKDHLALRVTQGLFGKSGVLGVFGST